MVTDGIFTLWLVTACYHVLVARATYNSLKAIAELMSELFSRGQARNLFIYGKPGTGKALCIKHLLDEINKHAAARPMTRTVQFLEQGVQKHCL